MSGVYGKTKDYFAIRSINYSTENDTYYLTTKSGAYKYESDCEIQIVGSNNLTDKSFKATSVFVDKDFAKKIIFVDCDENYLIEMDFSLDFCAKWLYNELKL